ncbi:MAG TPA: SRPBCC family protein [Acidimicrobiia bacterium]|nr:SRPBCC family protein [Acidimicrobiia bacterium]
MPSHAAHNINVTIERPLEEVYDFVSKPENFPRWASGLAAAIEAEGDHWVSETPEGRVEIRFTPRNELGVLDHRVTMPSGLEVYVPMRVVANGESSEVMFTLFRTPGMTDEVLARDLEWVQGDLATLKQLLEGGGSEPA